MKKRRQLTVLSALFVILIALVSLALILPDDVRPPAPKALTSRTPTATTTTIATPWTDPLTKARGLYTPVRLIVPQMHLDAKIIPEGATATGAMATPHCVNAADPVCGEVYWWDAGVVPGQLGNTVIAGHVNRPDASPASFALLEQMHVGDRFQVQTVNGALLTFQVFHVEWVSAYVQGGNDPVINSIFGPATQPDLNLITCIGDWDGTTFNHRLVIQSHLVGTSPFPAA